MNNIVNQARAHPEFPRQLHAITQRGVMQAAYLNNVEVCQFVARMSFSGMPFRATFHNHIAHVRFMVSNPKMVWPYACAIVAVVKLAQAFWNRAKVNKPRGAMCGYREWESGSADGSIASTVNGSSPKPATLSFANVLPKALWEGWRKTLRSQVLRGKLVHSYFSLPRLITGQFGASSLSTHF